MLMGIFFVFLSNIAGVWVPVLVRQGLDDAQFQSNWMAGSGMGSFVGGLIITALGFGLLIVLAAAVKGVFMYLMRQFIIVVSRHIEYDLKNDIYAHYQKLDTSFYRKNFTGDMMARIGEDVSNVRMYTGPAVMYFANIIFVFVTVIFQMFHVNPTMTLYVLLPLPFLSFGIYKVSTIINRRTTEIQTQLSLLTTFAQETFAGIRVLKSFGAEDHFNTAFEKEGKEYRRRTMRLAFVNSLFFPLMMLLIGLSNLIVLYLGGVEAAKGTFTTGNIAEFVIYLNMLIWPVASLGWTTALVQKAAASQKRINEFLLITPDSSQNGKLPFQFENEIRFSNVDFTYEGSTVPALSSIDFVLPKGKILGITGRTGSGKSTIAQLVMRMYMPSKGVITIDGKPIDDLEIESFRHGVSWVPQDVFLFSDSIKENIAFGKEDNSTTDAEITLAAEQAGLTRDIENWPAGLETIIGERGVSLSGGQKQRVSIARALLRDAALYILDDCLSAVDAATEMEIVKNFSQRLKGRSAIIISHRAAPLAFADEILVLEEGKIIEKGSRDSLIAQNGEFAKMFKKQTDAGTEEKNAE